MIGAVSQGQQLCDVVLMFQNRTDKGTLRAHQQGSADAFRSGERQLLRAGSKV